MNENHRAQRGCGLPTLDIKDDTREWIMPGLMIHITFNFEHESNMLIVSLKLSHIPSNSEFLAAWKDGQVCLSVLKSNIAYL